MAKEFFTAITNRAVYSVPAADANAKKKITEFASVVVIIVQNILLFLQEQIRKYSTIFLRQDFVRQDFFRIFLEYNDNFFID